MHLKILDTGLLVLDLLQDLHAKHVVLLLFFKRRID